MAKIVIVVDTQYDFMAADGALSVTGAEALAPAMADWLAQLDSADTAAVLFTFDTHFRDTYPASEEAKQFSIHCVRGEPGWANVLDPAVVPAAIPTYRLEKGVFAMWEEPGLTVEPIAPPGPAQDRDAFFDALRGRGVEEATVIGVAADFCVKWAIDGLVARGFRVTVPRALTRGIARQIDAVAAEDFAGQAVTLA